MLLRALWQSCCSLRVDASASASAGHAPAADDLERSLQVCKRASAFSAECGSQSLRKRGTLDTGHGKRRHGSGPPQALQSVSQPARLDTRKDIRPWLGLSADGGCLSGVEYWWRLGCDVQAAGLSQCDVQIGQFVVRWL